MDQMEVETNNFQVLEERVHWKVEDELSSDVVKLPNELRTLPLISFLHNVKSLKIEHTTSESEVTFLQFTWESDYLDVVERNRQMSLLKEFVLCSEHFFESSLVHNHRKANLSSIIGVRLEKRQVSH